MDESTRCAKGPSTIELVVQHMCFRINGPANREYGPYLFVVISRALVAGSSKDELVYAISNLARDRKIRA